MPLTAPPNAAILVVSDDPEFADRVSHQLAAWGVVRLSVDCSRAPSTIAATARARASRATIAVIDTTATTHAAVVDAVCDDPTLDAVKFLFVGPPAMRATERLSPWRRRAIAAPAIPSPLYDALVDLASQRHNVEATGDLAFARVRAERLLVAEDSEVNRMLAVAQLKELGFTVDCVTDGTDAVVSAKTGRYALILMDSQMPVMDGLAATREIRAGENPKSRIPIIAMTASTAQDHRERCLAAGMDDYIAKPVLLAPLRTLLDKWLVPIA
jgi:CheY-like chemotaxis protein